MLFRKYQALGNDYLVLHPVEAGIGLTPSQIRLICDRHYGLGSDGLLVGPFASLGSDFRLRLFNPDGGEFEKSGNGLRTFARYLWDEGLVRSERFSVETPGGVVTCRVHETGRMVTVDMGQVSFDSAKIPVTGPQREVLDERLAVGGEELRYSAVTIGNPHCVVLCETMSAGEAHRLGPLLEREPRFPNRTNVQFMTVLDRSTIRIEIWERGVGYTLASGSSSCAAGAVAHRLGLVDAYVAVQMPGGIIDITISEDWSVRMTGAVTKVYEARIAPEMFSALPGTSEEQVS